MTDVAPVSICIPTYDRPDLLGLAIDSCHAQTRRPAEVIVSDDSPNDASEAVVRDRRQRRPEVPIRYVRNVPSLRQARNVDQLFRLAGSPNLLLLHDDDLLLPTCIEHLLAPLEADPTLVASFGLQQVIDGAGNVDDDATQRMNRAYHRTADRAGRQPSGLGSALAPQFPGNSFLVRTEAAREVGYAGDPRLGPACDFDFGLRLTLAHDGIYFVDRFVAQYRLGAESITRAQYYPHQTLLALQAIRSRVPPPVQDAWMGLARVLARGAVSCWLELGQIAEARSLYWSDLYPWKSRVRPRGLLHALCTTLPAPLSSPFVAADKRLSDRGGRRHVPNPDRHAG